MPNGAGVAVGRCIAHAVTAGFRLPRRRLAWPMTDDQKGDRDATRRKQAELAGAAYTRLVQSTRWLSLHQYVDALGDRGVAVGRVRERVRRAHGARRLLLVDHDGVQIVPTFQLDHGLELDPVAGDAVQALAEAGYGPWGIWDWAETPNTWLGGRTPGDVLRAGGVDDLARAVAAAVGELPDA